MSNDYSGFMAEAARLNLRWPMEWPDAKAALDAKDAEIERLRAALLDCARAPPRH